MALVNLLTTLIKRRKNVLDGQNSAPPYARVRGGYHFRHALASTLLVILQLRPYALLNLPSTKVACTKASVK